jgi:hypothetical protein
LPELSWYPFWLATRRWLFKVEGCQPRPLRSDLAIVSRSVAMKSARRTFGSFSLLLSPLKMSWR